MKKIMFRGLLFYVFILQSEFVFKQKFKFWKPLNVFVSLIGLLLNKSCKNSQCLCFKQIFLKKKYTENVVGIWNAIKYSYNKLHRSD